MNPNEVATKIERIIMEHAGMLTGSSKCDFALWRFEDGTWAASVGGVDYVMLGEYGSDVGVINQPTLEAALDALLAEVCAYNNGKIEEGRVDD